MASYDRSFEIGCSVALDVGTVRQAKGDGAEGNGLVV